MTPWMRLAMVAALALLVGCGDGGGGAEKKSGESAAKKAAAEKPAPPTKRPDDDDPKPRVELETSLGKIVLELDRKRAPISVENFLRYVEEGFYEGTMFHRVMPKFMIQTGGYDREMKKLKPGRDPIKNESEGGLSNLRGTVAMARLKDPDSARAQFFINVVDNEKLDFPHARGHGYAVFGKVVEGMDVVEKIRNVETEEYSKRIPHCPVEDVVVQKARRL